MTTTPKRTFPLFDNDMLFWTDKDHTKEYALWIQTDEEPYHPRNDMDNPDIMFCLHSRYQLGDKRPETSFTKFWENLIAEYLPETERVKSCLDNDNLTTDKRIADLQNLARDYLVSLPLWLYDHSGISISCGDPTYPYNDPFDAGLLGYIVMSKTTTITELGAAETNWKQKATEHLRQSVETYNQYLTGDVYTYTLYEREIETSLTANLPNNTPESDWEELDSCRNFYGSDLFTNGILDIVDTPDLKTALKSGNYTTGRAEPKKIVTWHFQKHPL